MKSNPPNLNSGFVFWGTDEFSVGVAAALAAAGLSPSLIITMPDRRRGRGLRLTPSPLKLWAIKHNIPFRQPEKLSPSSSIPLPAQAGYSLFIVASYGKILPKQILDLPTHGVLNVHPSLLPKYRGPSPIQSAILNGDQETGVSIIKLDEQMDHGPILISQKLAIKDQNYLELRDKLAKIGGQLIAQIIPDWLNGKISPVPQDDSLATYTKKIVKADGLISLDDNPIVNYRKFLAYTPWPGAYLLDKERVIIKEAHLSSVGEFIIDKIIKVNK